MLMSLLIDSRHTLLLFLIYNWKARNHLWAIVNNAFMVQQLYYVWLKATTKYIVYIN